jgi:hypothetical protein
MQPFSSSELVDRVRAIMRRSTRSERRPNTVVARQRRGPDRVRVRAQPADHSHDKIAQSRCHFLTASGLAALRALGESSDPLVQTFTKEPAMSSKFLSCILVACAVSLSYAAEGCHASFTELKSHRRAS